MSVIVFYIDKKYLFLYHIFMDNYINSDLIRGNIDTIILRSLSEGDKYGYEILKEIESKTQGEYILKQPTLYSCLKRLEQQGYITSFWGQITLGGRRKYYRLTPAGKEYFEKVQADWEYSRALIDKLIAKRRNNPQNDYQSFSQDFNQENDIQSTNSETNAFIRHFEVDNQASEHQTSENERDFDKELNQGSEDKSENVNDQSENTVDNQNVSSANYSINEIKEAINKDNEVSEQERTEEKKQIFIVAKSKDEIKNENHANENIKPQGIAIYIPLKGKPIYAKSERVLAEFSSSEQSVSPRDFTPKVSEKTLEQESVTNNNPKSSITFNQQSQLSFIKSEPKEDLVDNSLIGATKINYNADDVFFANQLSNKYSYKSYEDLMLEQKMELFKENITKYKKASNHQESINSQESALEEKLYSLPNDFVPEFTDTASSASGVTFSSIEEAQQALKIEKQYKNVLGKLFDNKNKDEIKLEKPVKAEPQEELKYNKVDNNTFNNNYYTRNYSDIKVSPFSKHTISEYYSSYYVYYAKFKLAQSLIFAAIMLLIDIGLYFLFNALKLKLAMGYYFAGGLIAALFALISILTSFYKTNLKKKVYYDFGKDILKKFYLWLVISAAFILGFYLADKNLFADLIHFSKALFAISLSFSLLILPVIAKIMLKLKAFSVKA